MNNNTKILNKDAPRLIRINDLRNLDLPLFDFTPSDDKNTRITKRESKRDLFRALTEAVQGVLVPVVALHYKRDPSKNEGRVANENYLALPGLGEDFHFGEITRVARSARGNIYFKLKDLARGDGINPWSWTCIRPDRISLFQYRGASTNPDKKPRTGEWTGRRV